MLCKVPENIGNEELDKAVKQAIYILGITETRLLSDHQENKKLWKAEGGKKVLLNFTTSIHTLKSEWESAHINYIGNISFN